MARNNKRLPFLGGSNRSAGPEGIGGVSNPPSGEAGGGEGEPFGEIGGGAGPSVAGTIDPVEVSNGRKRGPYKTKKQRSAARASRPAGHAPETPEEVALKPEFIPPEVPPSIVLQVAMMLQFVHGDGAMALSSTEAEMLAQAATNVGRFYVKLTVSAKGQAWGALLMTAAMIYGPKIMAAQAAAKARKAGLGPAPAIDLDALAKEGDNVVA